MRTKKQKAVTVTREIFEGFTIGLYFTRSKQVYKDGSSRTEIQIAIPKVGWTIVIRKDPKRSYNRRKKIEGVTDY